MADSPFTNPRYQVRYHEVAVDIGAAARRREAKIRNGEPLDQADLNERARLSAEMHTNLGTARTNPDEDPPPRGARRR